MPQQSSLTSFLAELKRRRVFRVAAVYAGIAFVIIQIIDGAFEPLGIPLWVSRLLIILLAVGFPVSIALAWAFDITAEGVVKTPARKGTAAPATPKPIFGNKVLVIVALLAVGAAMWSWWGRPLSAGPITSIAVLPLENLMNDPEQDYFVDGMHDALIMELQKIRALRVISRTSVMQYKKALPRLPEVARELNVDAVVEGTVLRAGGRIRITTQLIGVSPERHLWAHSYERDLSDILKLQSEVAQAIAAEIKIAVTPEEEARLASARPVDPEAHEAYLKGRYYWNMRTGADLRRSVEYFREAVSIDSTFALGHVGLADAFALLPFYTDVSADSAYSAAKIAARSAIDIDDTMGEPYAALGWVYMNQDRDWARAGESFKRAIALNPNFPTAHQWYSLYFLAIGRLEESVLEMEKAYHLAPLTRPILGGMTSIYRWAGRYDDALQLYQKWMEIDDAYLQNRPILGEIYLQQGNYQQAIHEFQRVSENAPSLWLAYAYAKSGDTTRSRTIFDALGDMPLSRTAIATLAEMGEIDQALGMLEEAFQQKVYWLLYLNGDPRFARLRDDPRFQELLRRMNFPE